MKRLRAERDEARTSLKACEATQAKTAAQLAKHAKLLPTLQAKMDELSANHAESKKRKDAEIARERESRKLLQEKHDALGQELKQVQAEKRLVQSKLDDKSRLCDSMRIEIAGLKRVNLDLRHAQEVTTSTVSSHLATLKAGHEAETGRLRAQNDRHTFENSRLARQLADKAAQFTLLAQYCAEQQELHDLTQEMLDERDDDVDQLDRQWREERDLRVREKDWRQRARSDERLIAWQAEDLEDLVEEHAQVERERKHWVGHLDAAVRFEREAQAPLLAATFETLDELKHAEAELTETKAALATTRQELAESVHSVAKLTAENDDLVRNYDRLAKEQDELAATHQELVAVLADERSAHSDTRTLLVQSQKEAEKEKTEKKRIVALLGMARKATESLTRDLNECASSLNIAAFDDRG